MLPTVREGQLVVARKKPYKLNDIVIAVADGREIIKRVRRIKPTILLVGDNQYSAQYDGITESAIVGVVIWPTQK